MGAGTPMEDVMVPEGGNGNGGLGLHGGGESRATTFLCQEIFLSARRRQTLRVR
jgi:hypothetical protein